MVIWTTEIIQLSVLSCGESFNVPSKSYFLSHTTYSLLFFLISLDESLILDHNVTSDANPLRPDPRLVLYIVLLLSLLFLLLVDTAGDTIIRLHMFF